MKKLVSAILILGMISIPMSGYANSDAKRIKKEIERIESKYGNIGECQLLDDESNVEILYSFNSLEEFEAFVAKQKKEYADKRDFAPSIMNDIDNQEIVINRNSMGTGKSITTRSQTYNDVHTFTWWAPFVPASGLVFGILGKILCWKNITVSMTSAYVNDKWQWQSINSCSSYLSGFNSASWHQTGWASNIYSTNYTNDSFSVTVHGYYLFGITIEGVPIGITQNDTWTKAMRYQ